MSGLDDYPRGTFCGPDATLLDGQKVPDACADWRVTVGSRLPHGTQVCDGARFVDGVRTLCDHRCHGMPDTMSFGGRPAGRDHTSRAML